MMGRATRVLVGVTVRATVRVTECLT